MRGVALTILLMLLALSARAELSAAASSVDITPDPKTETVWMAGFSTGRQATGIHDPLCSRAVVVSDGKTKVALVALDLVGIQRPAVEAIRKEAGTCVDYLLVAATHNHEGPDTMGLWGETPFVSGVDPKYLERVVASVSAQVQTLAENLRPASMKAIQVAGPVKDFVRDSRDPVVIDDALSAFQLTDEKGRTIATVVNWANHPETLWSHNTLLTADYPGYVVRRLEEKSGGTGIFFSGALGGMMTPDHRLDDKGDKMHTFEEAQRIGEGVADVALDSLAKAASEKEPALAFRAKKILLPVSNRRFHLAMGLKILVRDALDAEGKPFDGKLSPQNVPWIESEVGVVSIGPVTAAAVPGELFPELAVGGYDGSKSFGKDVVKKDNPNPPDLEKAPHGPFLRDLMDAKVGMIFGLANDELGYILPEYDFKANLKSPTMDPEPPGDHYEETNSLGIKTAGIVMEALAELLKR